jgi:hypothetical protein
VPRAGRLVSVAAVVVDLFLTRASGWILVVLIPATASLPYLMRRPSSAPPAPGGRHAPLLVLLRPHYLIGYAIAAVVLAHIWVPMSDGQAGAVDATGLYVATGASVLVFAQVAIGRTLRDPRLPGRRWIRRAHFWTMVAIAALAAIHIAINGGTLRSLL